MIAEVIYTSKFSTGFIIGITFALLIGLNMIVATSILIKQKKLKPIQISLFFGIGFLIIAVSIFSLIKQSQ